MTTNTARSTEWTDETEVPAKANDFWRQTDNTPEQIRFVGKALSYGSHYMENIKRTVNCAGEGCILCQNGIKLQQKFISVVYNHTQDRPVLFTFGVEVKGSIREIVKVWGSPENYSMTLTRTNNGRYKTTVVNNPPTALTAAQKAKLADFTARVGDLSKFTAAPTAQEVKELTGLTASSKVVDDTFVSITPKTKLVQSRSNTEVGKL